MHYSTGRENNNNKKYILYIQVVKNPQDLNTAFNQSHTVAVWLPQTLQKVLFCLKLL